MLQIPCVVLPDCVALRLHTFISQDGPCPRFSRRGGRPGSDAVSIAQKFPTKLGRHRRAGLSEWAPGAEGTADCCAHALNIRGRSGLLFPAACCARWGERACTSSLQESFSLQCFREPCCRRSVANVKDRPIQVRSHLVSLSGVTCRSSCGGLGRVDKATRKRELRLLWREADSPNHLDDNVDSDQ